MDRELLSRLAKDILEWKINHRNIYYIKIGNNNYIFRLLSKSEYLSLYFIQFHLSYEAEDILLERCVLFPKVDIKYLDNLLAGEVSSLVMKILDLSGFSNVENIKKDLEKERESIQVLDNQIVLLICKAFPHVNPSDIDQFDYPTILHYLTLAEEILGTKLEITKVDPANNKTIDFTKENAEQGFIMPNKVHNIRPPAPKNQRR